MTGVNSSSELDHWPSDWSRLLLLTADTVSSKSENRSETIENQTSENQDVVCVFQTHRRENKWSEIRPSVQLPDQLRVGRVTVRMRSMQRMKKGSLDLLWSSKAVWEVLSCLCDFLLLQVAGTKEVFRLLLWPPTWSLITFKDQTVGAGVEWNRLWWRLSFAAIWYFNYLDECCRNESVKKQRDRTSAVAPLCCLFLLLMCDNRL